MNPRLLLFTADEAINQEAALLGQMFALGLARLHLRRNALGQIDQLVGFKQAVAEIVPSKYWGQVILHQAQDHAAELGFAGVHFRERDLTCLNEAGVRDLKNKQKSLILLLQ